MSRLFGSFAVLFFASMACQAAIYDVAPLAHSVKTATTSKRLITGVSPRAATNVVFDFDSWDEEFDTSNDMPSIDLAAATGMPAGSQITLVGIGWNFDIEVQNFSWFSESVIKLGDDLATPTLFLQPGVGDDFGTPATMNYNTPIVNFAANSLPDIVLADGILDLELYELLDDSVDAIDADYLATSMITFDVLTTGVSGDFDSNGDYACADVDPLVAEIVGGTNDPAFDITGDGSVNSDDLTAWLAEAGAAELASGNPYLPADVNLDSFVDGQDFIVWNNNRFQNNPAFCSGDMNADGVVDGQDFIIWNTNRFTSADPISAVPEPAFGSALLLLTLWIGRRRAS